MEPDPRKPAAPFPRTLRPRERDLLETVLPGDRPGYRPYRTLLATLEVIGEGRRGEGNIVLGRHGDTPDLTSPLGAVVAFGGVETTRGTFSISIREEVEGQVDAEIVSSRGEAIPEHFEEVRRWTYSTWTPGMPSPWTGEPAREVPVREGVVLAVWTKERRLLLHDAVSGMNHLLPVTGFFHELIQVKNIRDARTALRSEAFFSESASYADSDLRDALLAYNKRRPRVRIEETEASPGGRRAFSSIVRNLFGNQRP